MKIAFTAEVDTRYGAVGCGGHAKMTTAPEAACNFGFRVLRATVPLIIPNKLRFATFVLGVRFFCELLELRAGFNAGGRPLRVRSKWGGPPNALKPRRPVAASYPIGGVVFEAATRTSWGRRSVWLADVDSYCASKAFFRIGPAAPSAHGSGLPYSLKHGPDRGKVDWPAPTYEFAAGWRLGRLTCAQGAPVTRAAANVPSLRASNSLRRTSTTPFRYWVPTRRRLYFLKNRLAR